MRTLGPRRCLATVVLAAAVAASVSAGAVGADPKPNDHNCQAVDWTLPPPGWYAERAHQAREDGVRPADYLGQNWAGIVDDNYVTTANCGDNGRNNS